MSASEYDKCLQRLRSVKYGDYVLVDDVNAKIDCLKTARDWMLNISVKYNLDPKYVYELDPYLSVLRYVAVGDTIEPEHHNTVVDALKKLREVLEKVEGLVYNEGYQAGYREGFAACYEQAVASVVPVSQTNTLATIISGTHAYGQLMKKIIYTPLTPNTPPHSTISTSVSQPQPNTVEIRIVSG